MTKPDFSEVAERLDALYDRMEAAKGEELADLRKSIHNEIQKLQVLFYDNP